MQCICHDTKRRHRPHRYLHRPLAIGRPPFVIVVDVGNVIELYAEFTQSAGVGDSPLNAKEKAIHEKGLVAVLRQLHEELAAAVLDAYGWPNQPDEQTMLERLVALNTQRRAEEAAGTIHLLRPEFQNPNAQAVLVGAGLPAIPPIATKVAPTEAGSSGATAASLPWPSTLPDQLAAVAKVLTDSPAAQTEAKLAANFAGRSRWKSRLPDIIKALEALGRARRLDDGRWMG